MTLRLQRELLAELTAGEMREVGGAASLSLCATTIAATDRCPSFAHHTCVDCVTRQNC